MEAIKSILVVVDPTSGQQPAVSRANWLARNSGADVELVICYFNEYLGGESLLDASSTKKIRNEIIQVHEKRLEKLTAPLRANGISVTSSAIWDHPLHNAVVRKAIESHASIVMKDTHHHSLVSRAILTNTDWNLIRNCPMPLWLVRPDDISIRPVFLAAVDPMNEHDKPAALDDNILGLGSLLAEQVGGEVHAFHSYDPRIAFASATANAYVPVSLPLREISQQMHDSHQTRFEEITLYHDVDPDRTYLVAGMTHEELPALSRKIGAAVVVMGAVTRNRWKRLFIGATAERTLEHLPCDLLVVKPDWFETPVDLSLAQASS